MASQPHGGGTIGHMDSIDWEYDVIDSPTINAFVVASGKLIITTSAHLLYDGILNFLVSCVIAR